MVCDNRFPVSHLIETFDMMTRTKLGFVCFVAVRNCMRQQVAGRSSQRHATLPTSYVLQSSTPYWKSTTLYYKVLLQYDSVHGQCYSSTTLYYKVLLQYYSVLQSTNPVLLCMQSTTLYYKVLLCTTPYYSSTTLYYTVLLQYYSVLQSTTPVLQSTTPVLLRTTQYYSSTTLYYTVLLQYYSVLQSYSTTLYYKVLLQYYKVLLQYYSVLLQYCSVLQSTTLYYTVLLQYYSVLHSATPVLLCTTNYYSSTTLYYKVLLCTTKYYSSTTLYYKVLLQYYSHDWSASPMKLYLQCAEQQRCFYKITDCCACHGKWISWLSLVRHETLVTMRGATSAIAQTHQILRLPRKMHLMIKPCQAWNASYNAQSNKCHCPNSPNTAPATKNESHDWSLSHMKRYLQCAEQQVSLSKLTKYCACHAKWISWLILDTNETLFTMRGATSVIVQTHQILRLPRKMNLMIDPCHTWNAIYNARSNKCHCPNSPNTAPATQNESHDWSLTQMKRYLQCAEQHAS